MPIEVIRENGILVLTGYLTEVDQVFLEHPEYVKERKVDLSDLEIEDRMAGVLINWLRDLARNGRKLEVFGASAWVAHTLYRIGALEESKIQFVDLRDQLPYG